MKWSMMELLKWFCETGTDSWVGLFLSNNSILIGIFFTIVIMLLRYRAKKTPGTDDDELISDIEGVIKGRVLGIINKVKTQKPLEPKKI